MGKTREDRFAEVCELDVLLGEGSAERDCQVYFNVVDGVIELEKFGGYTVRFAKARLQLDLEGYDIVPKSKHGEFVPPSEVELTRTLTHEAKKIQKADGKTSVELSLGTEGLGGKFAVGGSASKSEANKLTMAQQFSEVVTIPKVRAMPGGAWEIREFPEGKKLDGVYLNYSAICRISKQAHANRAHVALTLSVKKSDIDIRPAGNAAQKTLRLFTDNKKRIFELIVAKAISDLEFQGKSPPGTYILSKATVSDDDQKKS